MIIISHGAWQMMGIPILFESRERNDYVSFLLERIIQGTELFLQDRLQGRSEGIMHCLMMDILLSEGETKSCNILEALTTLNLRENMGDRR